MESEPIDVDRDGAGWRRFAPSAAASTTYVVGSGVALALSTPALELRSWALGAGLSLCGLLWAGGRALSRSERTHGPQRVSLATRVTVARGALVAVSAGFLLTGPPAGGFAWLPALAFGVAVTLDAADGAIARAIDDVTPLGARLDTSVDAAAILVGSLLVVRFDAGPVWFVAVGLARYLYVAGLRYRTVRNRPVSPLPERRSRRLLAACVMAVVPIALAPAPGSEVSRLLASIVAVPFLLGFARDYLAVTGRLGGDGPEG